MTALFLESQMSSSSSEDWLILGGLVQFFVGAIQLLGGFVRTIYGLVTKQEMKQLWRYWLMVAIYFLVLIVICEANSQFVMVWIPLAWVIAIWYWVVIVFKNKKIEI